MWLIDFNPFGEVTDSLLFTWEEIRSGNSLKNDQTEGAAMEEVGEQNGFINVGNL